MKKVNPSWLASAIIILAVIGFIFITVVLAEDTVKSSYLPFLKILRHGCEGALVGGICDFIAVRMVYETARKEFPSLRDNTATLVVKDMVKLREKVQDSSQIELLLSDPKMQIRFAGLVEDILPTQEDMRVELERVWREYLREDLIAWLIQGQFSHELQVHQKDNDINQEVFRTIGSKILRYVADEEEENRTLVKKIQALTQDVTLAEIGIPAEEEGIRHLLTAVWNSWRAMGDFEERSVFGLGKVSTFVIKAMATRSAPLVKTTTIKQVLGPLLTEKTVREGLLSFATKLEEESSASEKTNQVFDDFLGYSAVFLRAWDNIDVVEKVEVLDELFRIFEGQMLGHLSKALWDVRNQLLEPSSFLEKTWVRSLIRILSTQIEAKAEWVEAEAIKALQDQFDAMGAEGFVGMLQSRTQRQLDWIKVNGSGWGFLVGMIAGGITLLF